MPGPSIADLDAEARRRRQLLGEGAPQQPTAEDISYALQHLLGYGSVDSPSPFGHNRDVFMADHPQGASGYYNPNSGRYDSPTEVRVPSAETAPQGGYRAASSGERMGGLPTGGNSEDVRFASHDLSGLPSGGNAEARDPQVQNSVSQAQDMPGAAQQQDSQPDGSISFGQLLDMLSTYMENAASSNGT